MIEWFVDLMEKCKLIDDEYNFDTKEQRDFYLKFSESVLSCAKKNYVPYDLFDFTTEFCDEGAILKIKNTYLAFEVHRGQGTIVACYIVPKDVRLKYVRNYITLEHLNGKQHSECVNYKIDDITKRIQRLFKFHELKDDDIKKILNNILEDIE